jgi:hypothetical protein
MKIVIRVGLALVALLAIGVGVLYAAGRGAFGAHEEPGTVRGPERERAPIEAERRAQREAAERLGRRAEKQILFGDLHVHTTFSVDAFMLNLPTLGGEGAHPPADACDFARHCSALDFWSINDHDFSLTPQHWRETIESIRQCNAVSGDPANPDTVAFLGWEWTQVGLTPDDHYGHKNVVLKGTADDEIPTRPIASRDGSIGGAGASLGLGYVALRSGGRVHDFARLIGERAGLPVCETGVDVRALPDDCLESAPTPAGLFEKLRQWGFPSLVIPHGTTWGFYTPPGSAWDKQLAGDMHDPAIQRLIEVYSGHGDSEVYRDWSEVEIAADGSLTCPAPRPDYLPSCWQAGEIIRARCAAAGETAEECEARAAEARANAAAARVAGHLTVPGARAEEWLDAGQCRDCREPSFNYRPKSSAQYILALGNFDDGEAPRRFEMGFMASSDNHSARPGTGYKEMLRTAYTESRDLGEGLPGFAARPADPAPRSRAVEADELGFNLFETERQASFFMTGGLVAAHAAGRDRDSIWSALERREVYGTTGPRILLWFDLLNPPDARLGASAPMGSAVTLAGPPIFQARAVGSFEQLPGCPEESLSALGAAELERICRGECHHPADRRRTITRIEVVRVRPQQTPGEPVAGLIDDPWKVFACAPGPEGCAVTFTDPDYERSGRDAVYYVRAFEAEAPGVNAGGVRCERDESGACTKVDLCGSAPGDDCLAPHEPRAWSSPIWVSRPPAPQAAAPPRRAPSG